MTDKFRNKYRISSHRMPKWDYSGTGIYFITLVTQNRECNLGKIENNEMFLSDYGQIVKTEWDKSFEIRHELFLDEFIIMPNHIHAIVIIEKNDRDDKNDVNHVDTHGRAYLRNSHCDFQSNDDFQLNQSPPPVLYRKPKSISSFVAGFKSAINSKIDDYIDQNNLNIPKYNRNNHFFQPNYHDHIVRDDSEYNRIKNYIVNNPKNWNNDKFYG